MKLCSLALIAVLAAFGNLVQANRIKYTDCGSVAGKVEFVDITPCPSLPCVFYLGTTADLAIRFKTSVATQEVGSVVTGEISGVPIPLPLSDPNACDQGVFCPVAAGAVNTYNITIYMDPSFPTIKLDVKMELKDDNYDDIVCANFPVEIRN